MRAYTSIVDARRAELNGSPDSGCPTGIMYKFLRGMGQVPRRWGI